MDSIHMPLRMFYDNSAVVFMAKNNKSEVEVNTSTLSIYPYENVLKKSGF